MNKAELAKTILRLNFGTLDIETMIEYLLNFRRTSDAEKHLTRFNTYLLQEGLSQKEANVLMIKSLSLEYGLPTTTFWN